MAMCHPRERASHASIRRFRFEPGLALAALALAGAAGAQVSPAGPEFQVNTYTTGGQILAAIAADATGDFVVTWTSWSPAGTDTDESSIRAQRFDVPFFQDGFDSGDLSGWSEVEP